MDADLATDRGYTDAELIGAYESLIAELLMVIDELERTLDTAEDYVSDDYWALIAHEVEAAKGRHPSNYNTKEEG